MSSRPYKRPRVENTSENLQARNSESLGKGKGTLRDLLSNKMWKSALNRIKSNPEEASESIDPSALALSCRYGAPLECVQAILEIDPTKLRHLVGSRGNPLHEAIVCQTTSLDVIDLLLTTDIQLGTSTCRASLMQDVDGYTPLHLLIRRRFPAYITDTGSLEKGNSMMELLELMVKTSPEATVVPDRGEYEEPPIVMALKANVYAPVPISEAQIERKINIAVDCMLRHNPQAASCVFKGYRGKYTALHSAVFHGRCAETLELLIEAEKLSPSEERAGLLANTQGEMPLHFCAMRGEPPRSIALVAAAAPEAVTMHDSSGLTPLHWLWIRFVSTLLSVNDNSRGNSETISVRRREPSVDLSEYVAFATLVQGDFDHDLSLVRSLDPSVDFLRMRHIPNEVADGGEALEWAQKTVKILQRVRDRYASRNSEGDGMVVFSRIEAVASLFWTKLVSMLESVWILTPNADHEEFSIVRTAFACEGCPPAIALIVASMYPAELGTRDYQGRLPLHRAACRPWRSWDWPRQDGSEASSNARVLQLESALFLRTAMALSPENAASTKDGRERLPIHNAITTFIQGCCSAGRQYSSIPVIEMQTLLRAFVQLNPDSLHEPDPESGLIPFLHAAGVAAKTEKECGCSSFPDELATTVVYQLLRENPSLASNKSRS